MSFTGKMITEWADDGIHMTVVEAMSYVDAAGRTWSVPAGFKTDGASIPPEFWGLLGSPFTGEYRIAAVFHDAAYATLGITKADADYMLRECALELGCEHWRAEAIYAGVKHGGFAAYDADQRAAAQVRST